VKISNNRLALIVLSVSCVGMIGLTTIKNEQLRPIRTAVGYFLLPVQTGVNRVGSAVYSNFKNQEKMRTALSDNESLREQVATLTMENTRLQSDSYELSRLRKLYELNQTYGQYRMTGARVIAKDTGNWFHVFRIDKGARDGIKPDMNVVGDGGLIGIVTDVGDNYATVRSIIDDVSRVSAMAIQSNDTCIVSGNLQLYANGKLKISDITDTADIKDGDAIVTSTVSSKFLPGILIGYAGDLKTDPDRLTRSGTLVPVADFETIQEVLVILDLKSEMREDGSFETPRTSLPDPESLTAAETSAAEESSAASETLSGEESGAGAETTVAAESSESRTTAETTTAATTTAASTTAARSTTAASTTRAAETRRETTAASRETRQRETTASVERRQQETERTRTETTAAQPQESAAATEPVQTVESLPSNP
jgi:rod shape-determining protein mreC